MSACVKSKIKYYCKDKEKLKEFMKDEGFIFKNSVLENDDYLIDSNFKMLENNSCIRVRTINNKDVILSFEGKAKNISPIDIREKQKVNLDIGQKEGLLSLMAGLGYYKYVSINILKETYVKKDRQYYYSISIDTIENIGDFVDFDVYSEDDTNINNVFYDFESKMKTCIDEKADIRYRDYASAYLYNTLLKGENLNRILVEKDKIFANIKVDNTEQSIKDNITILNLELIEKMEQMGIKVEIVYSDSDEVLITTLKKILNRIGYSPEFINIKAIKEISVKETLIIEKQKKIDFSEFAFMILVNREERT